MHVVPDLCRAQLLKTTVILVTSSLGVRKWTGGYNTNASPAYNAIDRHNPATNNAF